MTFGSLLRGVGIEWDGDGPSISSLVIDSRKVTPGALFICMPGMTRDSESFLPDAFEKGAVAALVFSSAGLDVATSLGMAPVLVPDQSLAFNDAVWRLCDLFFDHPTRHMKVVGITGTNGKTTTAWILQEMFEAAGLRAAYLGTLGFRYPGMSIELPNTTPFAVDLYTLLAEARDAGVEALAMEVSSHALAQHRADGVEFDAGVFTNLTQDHLDFHGTMSEYEAAKLRLFTELPSLSKKQFVSVLNGEDAVGRAWSHTLSGPGVVFGTHADLIEPVPTPAMPIAPVAWIAGGGVDPVAFEAAAFEDHRRHVVCEAEEIRVDQMRVRLYEPISFAEPLVVDVRLGGSYNLQNTAAACGTMLALGYQLSEVGEFLKAVRPVPGRFEAVANDSGIGILVDYAHTPDALEKVLDAARPLTAGRLITVFGCGGDRDRTKRPLMAKVASSKSDFCVLTSDNPRTEDPAAILAEVETGIEAGVASVSIIDRPEAVAYAVRMASPGDVVVIAGKGHENYQIIGREKIHMDDRELALAGLAGRTA